MMNNDDAIKLYQKIKSSTNIIDRDEFTELMRGIARVASNMVKKTLGPYGATTIIDDGMGFSYPSKDGWSTLSKLKFSDPLYNTLYTMLKKISFNSVTSVGDGTTTAMVAAAAFIDYFENNSNEIYRQADFIEVCNIISKEIEYQLLNSPNLKRIAEDDSKAIYNIAYTATNGNDKVSKIIEKIYKETKNPNIHVDITNSDDIEVEIQEGYKLEAATMNFKVYVNTDNNTYETSTRISTIIFDHNVTYNDHNVIIGALSSIAEKNNTTILILAPYYDDTISSIISSRIQALYNAGQVPNIILAKFPYGMDYHRATIQDLSVITNGAIFDTARLRAFQVLYHNQTHEADDQIEDDILEVEDFKVESPQDLITSAIGKANNIVVSKDNILFQNYNSVIDENLYKILLEEVNNNYQQLKTKAIKTMNGTLDKDYRNAKLRYVNLLGKIGVIHIGGTSDIQKRCDKDSIDDAVAVCKSAYENGYVRGAALEIISVITKIKEDIAENKYEDLEYIRPMDIEKEALLRKVIHYLNMAFQEVTSNTYYNKYNDVEYKSKVEYIGRNMTLCISEIISFCVKNNLGYDLVNDKITEMDNLTVISSVYTDLEIVKSVLNMLTLIMSSNQFLSMTKMYDTDAIHLAQLEIQKEDRKELAKSMTYGVLDALEYKKLKSYDAFRDIFL